MTEFMELFYSVLRFSGPLMLVALGGYLSEKSGVINIALEGLILFGAFFAAAYTSKFGNPWIGLAVGGFAGGVIGLLYAFLVVGLKSDQIVSGTAINMLAWGGIPFFGKIMFDSTASTPALELIQRLPSWIPIVLAVVALLKIQYIVKYTPLGLWFTFAGEKPEALLAVGIRYKLIRWCAVTAAGFLAGIGGAVLSISLSSSYTRNMSAGRGFMALAALILGKWRPVPTILACLLFGISDVLQLKLQGMSLPLIGEMSTQIVQILPYILTLIILAGFIGESRAPAAIGK